MKRDEFIQWARSKGWSLDRWGHLQKTKGRTEYRFKLGTHSVRYESRITFADGSKEWIRHRSAYYSKLKLNESGQISGFTRAI